MKCMKNGLICVALLLCIGAGLTAQFIYNPANTPAVGNGNSWPFNLYTGWRFQFIIDKRVLGSKPLAITDIAFAGHYSPTRTFSVPDFEMRMGHTTYTLFSTSKTTRFDTILGPSPTEVYKRGRITWACTYHAWGDIGLTSPFIYNGTDNVCVEIRYNTTASAGCVTLTDPTIARAYTHSNYAPDPFNEVNWYTPIPGEMMGPIHRLTVSQGFSLVAPGQAQIGTNAFIRLFNGAAGDFYQMAASLGNTFKINLGKCSIQLNPDPIFVFSVKIGWPIFTNYAGSILPSGGATGQLTIPNVAGLIGIDVYHAAVSYDLTGITGCTNTDKTTIIQ